MSFNDNVPYKFLKVYSHSLATPFTKIEYLIKMFEEGINFVNFNSYRIHLSIELQSRFGISYS